MKNKGKDKSNTLLIVGILLIIGVITVGYATLQTVLNINGTANIGGATWNIHFENIEETTETNVIASTSPTAVGTSTINLSYSVNLVKPGDMYQFTADIVNSGSIDAKLSGLVLSNLPTGMDYITYTVTYADGSPIEDDDVIPANNNNSRKILVTVEFDRDLAEGENLSETTTALDLDDEFTFVQA